MYIIYSLFQSLSLIKTLDCVKHVFYTFKFYIKVYTHLSENVWGCISILSILS